MRKVIMGGQDSETIYLEDVEEHLPIFAKKEGEFCGMLVNEQDKGWIVRVGGSGGCSGWHKERRKCIERARELGYEFFT